MTDKLKTLISDLRELSNDAYTRYIRQMQRDECLGAEYKMGNKLFKPANLKAHCTATEWLGKHRAYEDSIAKLKSIQFSLMK